MKLKWSKKTPTISGYYWVEHIDDDDNKVKALTKVYKKYKSDKLVFDAPVFGGSMQLNIECAIRTAGPIQEPE